MKKTVDSCLYSDKVNHRHRHTAGNQLCSAWTLRGKNREFGACLLNSMPISYLKSNFLGRPRVVV